MLHKCSTGLFVVSAAAGLALAGPDWTEVGDAGKLTPQAIPFPVQPQFISGSLGDAPLDGLERGPAGGNDADGGPDVADVYDIQIDDNEEFIATTYELTFQSASGEDERTGPTNFDTALWVFRLDKRGLLANNDISVTNNRSRILPIATDGTGSRILTPGRYLLAVSYGDVAPVAMGGFTLFSFTNNPGPTQVSGPDGQGGSMSFTAWVPNTPHTIRKYRISIRPTPCPPPCIGDANGDNIVNFADITATLASWNMTCP